MGSQSHSGISVTGLAVFSTALGFTGNVQGLSKMSMLGALRFSGVYRWEETSVSLHLLSLGPFDIVNNCQFSICLILLSLFVNVPSCPILSDFFESHSFYYAPLFP